MENDDRVVQEADKVLFEPIFGKVVIEVSNSNLRRTNAGLYVPEPGVSQRTYGVIVAVFEEDEGIGPKVKVGDKVLFGQYSGTEVTLAGKEYIILREQDLLAVVHFEADEMKDDSRPYQKPLHTQMAGRFPGFAGGD